MQDLKKEKNTSTSAQSIDGRSIPELEAEIIRFFASEDSEKSEVVYEYEPLFKYAGGPPYEQAFDDETAKTFQEYFSRLLNSESWYLQVSACFAMAAISTWRYILVSSGAKMFKKFFEKKDYAQQEAEKNMLYFDSENTILNPRTFSFFLAEHDVRAPKNKREDAFMLCVIKSLKACNESVEDIQHYRYAPKEEVQDSIIEDKLLNVLDDMKDGSLKNAGQDWYYYTVARGISPTELERIENNMDNGYMKFFCHLTESFETIWRVLRKNEEAFNELLYEISSEHFVDRQTREVLEEMENIENYGGTFALSREKIAKSLINQNSPIFRDINKLLNDHLNLVAPIREEFESESGCVIRGDRDHGVYELFDTENLDYMLGNEKETPFDFSALSTIPTSAKKDLFVEKIISVMVRFHLRNDQIYQHHSNPRFARDLYNRLKSERKPTTLNEIKTTEDFWADIRDFEKVAEESMRKAKEKMTVQKKPIPQQQKNNSTTTVSHTRRKVKNFFREVDLPYLIWGVINFILLSGIFKLLGLLCIALPIIALYTKKEEKYEKPIHFLNIGCTAFALLRVIVRLFIIMWN